MNPIRLELPTEFDVGTVNAYLFIEPEPVLVDCGVDTPASWQALTAGLAANGLTPGDIRRIVITHPHVDHFGQAAKLAELSGAAVWVADLGFAWLTKPRKMFERRIEYYRQQFLTEAGLPEEIGKTILAYYATVANSITPVPVEQVQTFRVGDQLEMGGSRWQVLHMPGHASHQTCFYQPDRQQLLSADMLLPKTPTPIVERPSDNQPRQPALPIFLESLSRCERLDIDTVYPGHGAPFKHHRQLIQEQRARIHRRKDEALALISQGHQTAYALMNVMYAHYPVSFRFAGLWMLIGYLDLLEAEGKITVRTVAGVWNFFSVEQVTK